MILIPVKNLAGAKQRLASIRDQPSRTQLAQSMLLDVADAVAAWKERPQTALVTSDPFAIEVARQFKFEVIADSANRSETDAIEMATIACVSGGADFTLVIPADVPLVQWADLQQVFEASSGPGTVLVPSAEGRGTNAVLRRPADLFQLRFGNDSFKPHLAAARATGHSCIVLSMPRIALDVDNPSDLRDLIQAPGNTRAQRLAREWEISEHRIAASE